MLQSTFPARGAMYSIDIDAAVRDHAADMQRCAYLCLRDYHLAEDICQETFLRLYRRPPDANSDAELRAWLLRVTMNLCRDYLRAPWRHRVMLDGDAILREVDTASPESDAIEDERDARLYNAVMALPLKYRQPIILHYYFSYSQQESAQILKISDSAFRSRLMRARKKLKNTLGEEIDI